MLRRKRNSVFVMSALLFGGAFGGAACDGDVDLGGTRVGRLAERGLADLIQAHRVVEVGDGD